MHEKGKPSLDEPAIIPLEEPLAENKPLVCRMCFAKRIERDAPCPNCGFDERAGLTASTLIGRKPLGKAGMKCATCGYDLTGLPSLRCPECGTVVSPPTRRDRYRELSKEVARETYRTPLLMIAIGGGLLVLTLMLMHGPSVAGMKLLSYAIQVPFGVAVFLLCCLIWIGFDAPIHLTALRLTGIYMVVDLVGIAAGYIPFVGWLIPLALYVGLLSEMLELDLTDAVAVGILTFLAKLAVAVAMIAVMGFG